jgi:hypothetical protein
MSENTNKPDETAASEPTPSEENNMISVPGR